MPATLGQIAYVFIGHPRLSFVGQLPLLLKTLFFILTLIVILTIVQ